VTSRLVVVTATTDRARSAKCIESWGTVPVVIVDNGGTRPYLGPVLAFRLGVDQALDQFPDAEIIACFHDDLEIHDPLWDAKVLRHFYRQPACGLAGFGGAIGLGCDNLYTVPYDPMQLARIGFRSNMSNAEAHGMRSLLTERVACLDGFSQIGRRAFWEGCRAAMGPWIGVVGPAVQPRPFTYLDSLGVVHHFYDGMLGCLAARYGWETWYLPIACHHFGGQTAVGDRGYQAWAETQAAGGDQGFWKEAHRLGYDTFTDVLPLRV
jgi:hypothetical protein